MVCVSLTLNCLLKTLFLFCTCRSLRSLGKKSKVKYAEVFDSGEEDDGSDYNPDPQSPDQSSHSSPDPSPDQSSSRRSPDQSPDQSSSRHSPDQSSSHRSPDPSPGDSSGRQSNAEYQKIYRQRKLRGPEGSKFRRKEADRMKAYRAKKKTPEMEERIRQQNRARSVETHV